MATAILFVWSQYNDCHLLDMVLGPEVDDSKDIALGAMTSLSPISVEDSEELCQSVTRKFLGNIYPLSFSQDTKIIFLNEEKGKKQKTIVERLDLFLMFLLSLQTFQQSNTARGCGQPFYFR